MKEPPKMDLLAIYETNLKNLFPVFETIGNYKAV